MHRLPRLTYPLVVLGVTLTSCGGSGDAPTAASRADETTTPSPPSTVVAPVVTPVVTTTPDTTTSSTSTTSTTAAATGTTTATTSSTAASAETGWSALDPGAVSVKAFPPCCGDTWHGEVSPELGDAEQPLADGPYAAAMDWPADLTEPLALRLARFERCAVLPDDACEPPGPDGYGPDDLGVDSATTRTVTVPVDADVSVVVVGWDTRGRFDVRRATGTELAALAAELERTYAEVFARPVLDGREPNEVVLEVIERPRSGFGPGVGSVGAVAYTPSSGPTLLFQTVYPYVDGQQVVARGVDVLDVGSLDVLDGRVTLYVYAAYVP